MQTLLGFHVSGWDYLTFLVTFIIGVAFLALVIFTLGLPGRIAIARNHADAVSETGDPSRHSAVRAPGLT
jgi:hypothetical protein